MRYNRQAFCNLKDKEKLKIIKEELSLVTHNGTTKDDLLMLLDWTYNRLVKGDMKVDGDVPDTNASDKNGWILCRDNMPTKDMDNRPVWIVYGSHGNLSVEYAYCDWVYAEDEYGNDDSYSEFRIDQAPEPYHPSANLVHAWKPVEIPEPYKQN